MCKLGANALEILTARREGEEWECANKVCLEYIHIHLQEILNNLSFYLTFYKDAGRDVEQCCFSSFRSQLTEWHPQSQLMVSPSIHWALVPFLEHPFYQTKTFRHPSLRITLMLAWPEAFLPLVKLCLSYKNTSACGQLAQLSWQTVTWSLGGNTSGTTSTSLSSLRCCNIPEWSIRHSRVIWTPDYQMQ